MINRPIAHEPIGLPIGNEPIVAEGRYHFGRHGFVDFFELTENTCGCGGCIRAESRPARLDDPRLFNQTRVTWLESIRDGAREPKIYKIVSFGGCLCCGLERNSCGCIIKRGESVTRATIEICLLHKAIVTAARP